MLRRVARRIRLHPMAVVACLLVLACLVVVAPKTVAQQSPLDGQDLRQHLAVPAYMDPTAEADGWSQLSGAESGTVGIVVANVDNGPDSAAVPAWASEIDQMHTSGSKVLGYVDTGYLGSDVTGHPDGIPTRAGQSGIDSWIPQIEADVNAWYRFYGSDIDGIFFDEGTNTCGPSSHSDRYAAEYEFLTKYVKELHPGAMTALNPGTAVPQCYESSADVLVTFEGSYGDYTGTPDPPTDAYQPLSWSPVDPNKIWNIVYGTATESEMANVIALSKSRNAGYVYVTDGVPANPYDTIPSAYWSQEQALSFPSGSLGSEPPSAPTQLTASVWSAGGSGANDGNGWNNGDGDDGDDGGGGWNGWNGGWNGGNNGGNNGWGGGGGSWGNGGNSFASGSTDVVLDWQPSTAGSASVVAFDVYQGSTWVGSVGSDSDSYLITGLSPSTSYSFTVLARDSYGDVSSPSATATATTDDPDPPPDSPTSLTVTDSSYTTTGLQWTPPDSGDQVARYVVSQDGTAVATVPASLTSVEIQGLQPGLDTYTFSVQAEGVSGGVSTPSNSVEVTTTPLPNDEAISSPDVVDNGDGTFTYSAQFATPFAFRRVFISTGTSPCWTTSNATPICGDYLIENDQVLKYAGSGSDFTYSSVADVPPTVTDGDEYSWTIPASDIGSPTGQVALFNGEGYVPLTYTAPVSEGTAPTVSEPYSSDDATALSQQVQSAVQQFTDSSSGTAPDESPPNTSPLCPSTPDDTWHLRPFGGCMVGTLTVADSLVDGLLPGSFTVEVTDIVTPTHGSRGWNEQVTLRMQPVSGTVPDYSITVTPTCSNGCSPSAPTTVDLVAGQPVTLSFDWSDPGSTSDLVNVATSASLVADLPSLSLPFTPTADPPITLGWSTPSLVCQTSDDWPGTGCRFPEWGGQTS